MRMNKEESVMWFEHHGRFYKVLAVFKNADGVNDANLYMQSNKDTSLLAVTKDYLILANVNDSGVESLGKAPK